MADIEYSIKSTLPIEVHVGASEASATICWLGAVKDNTNCLKCDEEKIYCENVYIGANGCIEGESSERRIESALTWNNLSIPYVIIQDPAICSTCGEVECTVDVLNHWVSPYIVEPCASSTTLYWEYWITKEDECDIFREKVLSSTTLELGNSACIDCHEENRTQTGDFNFELDTESCHLETKIPYEYYIQKPDVCCDLSGDCYEINEIVYNPTSVSSEGGLVDFSFDYKRIEIDEKCETKETYGTYFGKWQVPPCKGDDCCYTKTIQSAFTWFDICGRGDVSACTISSNTEYDDGDIVFIPNTVEGDTPIKFSHEVLNDKNTIYLSILRDRPVSADCDVHCDFDTLYCVDKSSIKMEYYDYDTGKWSGFTEDEYIFPYYGGRLKVSWNYYIITVYDDCKVGVSSGNPYTDLLTVLEYDDCKDHEDVTTFRVDIDGTPCTTGGTASVSPQGICASNNSTRNLSRGDSEDSGEGEECKITVTSVTACTSGGSVTIKPLENIVENKEEYKFKKGLCDLLPSQLEHVKRNLPASLQYVCDEEEKCNEFTVTYYQFKKDCNPDCVPCFPQYMIDEVFSGGSAVTLTCREGCDLTIKAYGDGEKINGTFKNDCSGWVTVNINKPDVTFTIAQNDGPYRRGKVIFLHDDKCEEEIVINQYGPIDEFEEYVPDPGYDCDLVINDITICSSGGTGTITPDGGESKTCELTLTLSKNELCADEEGDSLKITVGGSETCDDTKITFTLTNSTVSGCAGKRLIGYYKYNCSNFNQNLLKYSIDDSDWTMVLDAPTNKKGNVYVVTKDNPSMTELNTVGFYLDYDGNDFTGWITIKQSPRTSDCSNPYPDMPIVEDELFNSLRNSFNTVLTSNNRKAVTSSSTYNVYDYLRYGYSRAVYEFNSNSSELFDKNTYSDMEVVDYRTTGTYNNNNRGLSAMTAWLMAMQLSEIVPTNDTDGSGNIQTELFKKAYIIGGGHNAPLYGYSDIHSDISVVRLIASAIYAIIRAKYNFGNIDSLRGELCISQADNKPISEPSKSWADWFAECSGDICDGVTYTAWYGARLDEIFNTPPGPFAKKFYEVTEYTSYWCDGDKSIGRNIPQGQNANLFDSQKNYKVDANIDSNIVENYNLVADDRYLTRSVQAVADDSESMQHLFANKTYYKYDRSLPFGSFIQASSTDNMGYFDGVFSSDVTGKDLSSLLADRNNQETDFADFFETIQHLTSTSRKTLLNPNYGRRRPGQGENDMSTRCGNCIQSYHDFVCTCDESCISQNWLDDYSIYIIVGSGTKYYGTNPITYYIDKNGNGYYDSALSEPIVNNDVIPSSSSHASMLQERCQVPVNATTYPSGHSAGVWGVALFLMEMLPDKWIEIYKAAYRFTVSRTIVRAHWNSDIIYGKLVATTTVPIIHAYYNFQEGNFRDFFGRIRSQVQRA